MRLFHENAVEETMDVNIQKYQAFVETAACGSFTRAAERLHYTQSGVSRMIRDLEEEWRVTLLERGRGGVKLTSDGTKLLPFARNVCEEYAKLRMQVDELSGLRAGLIRVGALSGVGSEWLPAAAAVFQKEYPMIDYSLRIGDQGELESWVLSGQVDLALLALPAGPELETVFLEQEELLAVLPQGHPDAGGNVLPIAALMDLPFLLLEKEGPSEISRLLSSCGIAPHIRLSTWDDQAILRMVERGLGVSILPAMSLRHVTGVAVRRLDVPAYRNLGLALRSKKAAPLAVRRFLESVVR